MKRGIWKSMAAGAIAMAAALQGAVAAPASFAYQGVIQELGGNVPTNKNRVIEFRIYDGAESPNVLWGRAYSVLLDQNGLFNAPLADTVGTEIEGVTGTGLAKMLADYAGKTLYVGLTVDGSSGEISPRQAILAVPYAIQASDAAGASGDFPVAGALTAGTLTANTLTVSNATELASVEAASLSVSGDVKIIGGDGVFVGPGTVPVGGIILWSGSADSIPEGWALCDGNNRTPNLSGRFVVGYDPNDPSYNAVGNTGGAPAVALALEEMPSHAHGRVMATIGYTSGFNTSYKEVPTIPNNYHNDETYNNGNVELGAGNSVGGDAHGNTQAHENRPPYYAICFIMRVK